MQCPICDTQVSKNDSLPCYGICHRQFHTTCANLSRGTAADLKTLPNLHWYCDRCVDTASLSVFHQMKERMVDNTQAITSLTELLQNTLGSTMEKISSLAESVASAAHYQPPAKNHQPGLKRPRSPDSPSTTHRRSKAPTMPLTFGTGNKRSGLIGVERPPNGNLTERGSRVEPYKSIYVSRCSSSTLDSDIMNHLVSNSLIA